MANGWTPARTAHPGIAWRETMERRGITQATMSRRTGYSQKHINQFLQGNTNPTPEMFVKMAVVLYEDDPAEARKLARLLYGQQGWHEMEQAFRELKDWQPLPDAARRRSRVAPTEGEQAPR